MADKSKKDDNINYGLGVLIILLLALWYVCTMNTVKSATCKLKKQGGHPYYRSGMYLGSSGGFCRGNNMHEVPNSNTSMRHLFDEQSHKYGSLERSSNIDDLQVLMHMEKRADGGCAKGPRSKTDSHILMSPSGHERDTIY